MVAFLSRRIAKLASLPVFTISLFLGSHGAFAATSAESLEDSISQVDRWMPYIQEAARRFDIAEDWIKAVITMESGGRTDIAGRPITSKAGAMGLMQMMPDTYNEMRAQYGLGADPYDPHDNVLAGAAYLKWLQDKFGYPKMFAAYNAGPGTLEAQMAGKTRLPAETVAYVKGITRILGDKSAAGEKSKVAENPTTADRRTVADKPAVITAADKPAAITAPDKPAVIEARNQQPSRVSVTYLPAEPAKETATLTRPDGSTVAIDGASVLSIRAALPDEYAPGVQTVIAMGNKQQGVREDPATVSSLLKRPIANV
jgi:hypothetical protein